MALGHFSNVWRVLLDVCGGFLNVYKALLIVYKALCEYLYEWCGTMVVSVVSPDRNTRKKKRERK